LIVTGTLPFIKIHVVIVMYF